MGVRANNTRFVVFLSSKDQPPYCAHRGNAGECEQWEPCAREQDRKGFPPVAWFAKYPGTSCDVNSINVQDCQVERPSRACDPLEKEEDEANGHDPGQCARPNGFALADLVGQGGGPEGVRMICTTPSIYEHGKKRGRGALELGFDYDDWQKTATGFKPRVFRQRRGIAIPKDGTPTCRSWEFTRSGARLVQ